MEKTKVILEKTGGFAINVKINEERIKRNEISR